MSPSLGAEIQCVWRVVFVEPNCLDIKIMWMESQKCELSHVSQVDYDFGNKLTKNKHKVQNTKCLSNT